ncbi:MAG: pilus assembly protein [Lachnospiraceae bacterium]|nr:pilus assembly protein [Lachnospiraceae bacterium]
MKHRHPKIRRYLEAMQDGMAAVEALFLFTLMIFIFMFFIALGYLYYQEWLVHEVAADTATRVAYGYVYPQTDPMLSWYNRDMKLAVSPYRYLFKKSEYEEENQEKGVAYAKWRLDMTSFTKREGEPEVEIKMVHDSFAQRHIEVTVTVSYVIPLGGFLEFFGLTNGKIRTYSANGYAMIMDPSDYMYSVKTVEGIAADLTGNMENTGKLFNAGRDFVAELKGIVDDIKEKVDAIKNFIKGKEDTEDAG